MQDWELPESIVEKKEGKIWEKHLYCDAKGNFCTELNSWETEALKSAMKDKDFVGWLRNLDRRAWAFCVPYEMGCMKPFYPDFVIVRKTGKGFVVDILEPHDDTRVDTLPKAIGLAKFSDMHGDLFGHLVIARKKGEKWQLADMSDKSTREKIKEMQPQSDLENLFG